jgi:prepilin-type N-terminal cleavage/methylation domain-containing protein
MLRKGFTLVELLVVIAIIVALAALSTPTILKSLKEAHMVEATSNSKQIYNLLIAFNQDWGTFPDDETADKVQAYASTNAPSPLKGSSSNAHLRQLIAGRYVESETIFYTHGPITKKPDNNMTGAEGLAAGEVGFGYIMVNDRAQNTSGNAGRPVLVTPLKEGATGAEFDQETFNGKAVILRLDGSVSSERLTTAGKVLVGGTADLLGTGPDSVWGDATTPKINPPLANTN